jgi:cation transport ATPase
VVLHKLQVKIGGMACSFCVETIQKGLGRMPGVAEVHVSLAHEEALITYDPSLVTPATLTDTLHSLGYTVRDPNKIRTFEDEEAELAHERDRLVLAGAAAWIGFLVMLLMWVGRHHPLAHWFMAALALTMVFGPGLYILRIAWASVRRRILNQHVLMEISAFGGLVGGAIGLSNPIFRTGSGSGSRSSWPRCSPGTRWPTPSGRRCRASGPTWTDGRSSFSTPRPRTRRSLRC